MSYTTVSGLGALVGTVTPSAAALCNADGGVKSYLEDPNAYTFTVTCNSGKSCKGGAEMQPQCSTPAPVCPQATGTDGPPGVPSSWPTPTYNRTNCLPDAQVNTTIRNICNSSFDPLYCYTAALNGQALLGRFPVPDAVAAWTKWVDAKKRGIAYCDSTVAVFGAGGDPRCPKTVTTSGGITKTTKLFPGLNPADVGRGGSSAPTTMPGSSGGSDNTMLYVGLGVAALAVVGVVYWKSQEKGAAS